jgi:hypothetical protein
MMRDASLAGRRLAHSACVIAALLPLALLDDASADESGVSSGCKVSSAVLRPRGRESRGLFERGRETRVFSLRRIEPEKICDEATGAEGVGFEAGVRHGLKRPPTNFECGAFKSPVKNWEA